MRLPIVAPIEARDGTVERDGLCKNLLVEQDEQGLFAALRPSLTLLAETTGVGNGLVSFNDKLLSVYGVTLGEAVSQDPTEVEQFNLGLDPNSESYAYRVGTDVRNGQTYAFAVGEGVVPGSDFGTYSHTVFYYDPYYGLVDLGAFTNTDDNYYNASTFQDASDDGSVVLILSPDATDSYRNKVGRWVRGAGTVKLLPSAGDGQSASTAACSPNGVFVAGTYTNLSGVVSAYLWSEADGFTPLALLAGGTSASANAVNDNGDVVGSCIVAGVYRPVKWPYGGAPQDIGTIGAANFSLARAITADGDTIIGTYAGGGGITGIFKWTSGTGAVAITTSNTAFGSVSRDCATVLSTNPTQQFWRDGAGWTTIPFTFTVLPGALSREGSYVGGRIPSPIFYPSIYELDTTTVTSFDTQRGYVRSIVENPLAAAGDDEYVGSIGYPEATLWAPSSLLKAVRTVATLDDSFFDFTQSV